MPSAAILIPLASAFLYAIAALMLKRATEGGVGPWRVSFFTNWILAILLAPLWLFGGGEATGSHLVHAAICAGTFFIGQIFTFLALSRGDVSVATPVLGTKVIFVALLAFFLTDEPFTRGMWIAAVLASIATALLGSTGHGHRRASLTSLGYGFSAAFAFAVTDVLVQRWAPLWGFGHFAPAMFLMVAFLSLGLLPFIPASTTPLPWRWLAPGAGLLALQAAGITFAIIAYASATTANVLYNSRAMWSVLLVWTIGPWFQNKESEQGRGIMTRRMVASVLILLAIVLVVQR